jgi:hypothetical protein
MTTHAAWARHGPILQGARSGLGVGLHLNLTSGAPLGPLPRLAPGGVFPSLGRLLGQAFAGRLEAAELRAEIERQLDAFLAVMDRPPDFVDGHQHVHVLPRVRGILLDVLGERGLQGRLWLRDPSDRAGALLARTAGAKAAAVRTFALGFRSAARSAGFETNEGFSGFSAFDPAARFEREMEGFLRRLGPRPVVMCHPGYVDDDLRAIDPVVDTRAAELAYLASPAFGGLLEERGISLVPWPAA